MPTLKSLQQLFDRKDVVDKVVEKHRAQQISGLTDTYKSSQDGSHTQENSFLSGDKLRILVSLYIDDLRFAILWVPLAGNISSVEPIGL